MSRQTLTVTAALAVSGLMTVAPAFAAVAVQQPASSRGGDAAEATTIDRLVFRLQEASLGPGYGWGNGVLHYKGKDYDVRVTGGGGPAIGYSHSCAEGSVSNLGSVDDFDSTFWSVGAEATAGSGIGTMALQNGRGVELHLSTRTSGARLSAETARYRFRILGPAKQSYESMRCPG
ncbi:hypothetical protein [Acetobacter oeni]|uniref:hypothetical protein n=1 Tax=Acetobacter oeni TaxID=304077 RepID=UPI0011BD887E|nr:hypothetical protein [Acetobacter oeni]MBB3882828.1 hypothetical protein [Acetobacter oeni]NHO18916.1 hypothetical protein [Acetobacter oeni]